MGREITETIMISDNVSNKEKISKPFTTQEESKQLIPMDHYNNQVINYIAGEDRGIIDDNVKDNIKYYRSMGTGERKLRRLVIDQELEDLNHMYSREINMGDIDILEIDFSHINQRRMLYINQVMDIMIRVCGGGGKYTRREGRLYNKQNGIHLVLRNDNKSEDKVKEIYELIYKMTSYGIYFWNIHSISLPLKEFTGVASNADKKIQDLLESIDIINIVEDGDKIHDTTNPIEMKKIKFKNLIYINTDGAKARKEIKDMWGSIRSYRTIVPRSIANRFVSDELEYVYKVGEDSGTNMNIRVSKKEFKNIYREEIFRKMEDLDMYTTNPNLTTYGGIKLEYGNGVEREVPFKEGDRFILIEGKNIKNPVQINKQGMEIYLLKDEYELPYVINLIRGAQVEETSPIKEEMQRRISEDIDIFDF